MSFFYEEDRQIKVYKSVMLAGKLSQQPYNKHVPHATKSGNKIAKKFRTTASCTKKHIQEASSIAYWPQEKTTFLLRQRIAIENLNPFTTAVKTHGQIQHHPANPLPMTVVIA